MFCTLAMRWSSYSVQSLVVYTLCVHRRRGNDLARSHLGGPSRMIWKDRCETGQQEGGLDIGIPRNRGDVSECAWNRGTWKQDGNYCDANTWVNYNMTSGKILILNIKLESVSTKFHRKSMQFINLCTILDYWIFYQNILRYGHIKATLKHGIFYQYLLEFLGTILRFISIYNTLAQMKSA